jgi:hypothetical protein
VAAGRHDRDQPAVIRRAVGIGSLLGLALGTLMLLGTGPAFACSCVIADTAQHIDRASAVFTGQVVQADRERMTTTYRVQVDRVLKGTLAEPEVTVSTSGSSASCGVELPASKPVVFFTTGASDSLQTTLCSGTTLLTPALRNELTAALGPGTAPGADPATGPSVTPGPGDAGSPGSGQGTQEEHPVAIVGSELALAVGLGILALVAAVVIGVLATRRRRA